MKRKKYDSDAKLDREGERKGLVGRYTAPPEGRTCCSKVHAAGGCEHGSATKK